MHPNQMYARYTQLGGRAVLWLGALAVVALVVRFLLALSPLTPGAVLLSAMFLTHAAAARTLRRSYPEKWAALGRPSFIPSPERGGLTWFMWSGNHRQLGSKSLFSLAVVFNLLSTAIVYWLISLAVRLISWQAA